MNENQDAKSAEAEPAPAPSSSSDNVSTISNATSVQSLATSTTSKHADSTRPSSLPKPSGLKPPTKIGRLCSNAAPKPAVPISPRSDGSTDSVRKLSDDSRKHLSDLIEDEEDELASYLPEKPRSHRKASTGSSVMSMEALWEKHPRRLSEAGLRRSSDHSVVLTEDTDSFIIGERVWVGGTKPGQIAYIGETQFAPGDWAGIVLDEPIGKNDGAVAGVRYFQCSEKRGVFSRLTRLTRSPLRGGHDASPVSDAGSVFERPPSARLRRPLSPNGSVRSVLSSKMNASVSTTTNGELRLGDRVIVSSSRGSKAGILRYVGITDFASGIWAGVELDDPLGKNDGSVEGKRYFECAARFGLFAPIAKVSRSPSSRRPGSCAVHSNGRGTPLRRSHSRESLASLGTSVASSRAPRLAQRGGPRAASTPVSAKNTLQELLREKQHHLERLMKERELERAEVAKVSLQANRAETALAILQKEADQANNENEKLKVELSKLNKLLEDEKQKVEDLMFRTEEDNINREDYNKYKEAMEQEKAVREQKIRELEAETALQMARADAASAALLALEDQRTAENAALADQHKEELAAAHTLSSELQKLLDEAYALLKEKENEKDSLGKSMSEELSKVKAEAEKSLNEAKTKIAIAQTEFETQLSVVTTKLHLAESKLESEKQNVERLNKENSETVLDLNTKLTQLQATVDDKTHELNKVISVNKEHEVNLNKEITKLKMELSAKILDLEQLEDAKTKQETVYKSLQEEIARVKEEYTNKVNEYEVLLSDMMQQNEIKKTEVIQLQQSLSVKTKEYEKLLVESSTCNSSSEKLINEYKNTILERDKEIIKLKDEFEQTTANFNINHSKIAEEHKKEIDDRNTKIDLLTKEIEIHKHALDQTKLEFDTMNNQYTSNVSELQALKEENDNLKKTILELTQNNTELKAKLANMELEIGEFKRLYESSNEKCGELEKAKDKIEAEYMNLTGQTTDSSEQFLKLSQHLKETEVELQQLKDKNRETANNHGRIEQQLKQKLFKLQEDFSLERGQMVRTIDENADKIKFAENKAKEFEDRVTELNNRLENYETNNDKLVDENSTLKNEIEALKVKEQELVIEFDSIRKKLEIENEKYNEEVSLLKAEGVSSEVKLMEKVDQLTEAQNDLNNKLEEARKHEDALQKIVDDMNTRLNNQKVQYEREISVFVSQLASINEEFDNQKIGKTQLEEMIVEKENKVKDISLQLEMLQVDFKSNVEILNEKDHQIAQLNEELVKTSEHKQHVEEQLQSTTLEISSLKQKYDSLLANSSVEESLLKDHIEQLETLKKESALLRQENSSFETKYKNLLDELDKLKCEHGEYMERLKENKSINEELNKKLSENENLLKTHSVQHETDSDNILILQEELSHLKKTVSEQDNIIKEKERELSILNNNLGDKTEATQQLIQQLKQENSEMNEKYNKEIESLNNSTNLLQNRISEQDNLLIEFQQTKEKLVELQALLSKSDSDIKQLTNINEAQKCNYQDLFDHYKKESKQIKHELKAKLEECQIELDESKEKVRCEVDKHNQLQQKLDGAEKTILELNNKLELITVQQTTDIDKDDKLEKLTVELQQTRKLNAETLSSSEANITELKSNIKNRLQDLKDKEELIKKLQEDIKNLHAKVEITAREKALLEKELAKKDTEVRDKNDNKPANAIQSGPPSNQIQEEKEITDGQVSFLNSVIVDMQRKNEQLLARVQALESGSTGTEPLIFNGRKSRAVAPRLFCDICDVFDAHDTEDCPRQSAEPAAPAPTKRPAPPPRPYCDICEVFGHATENCDEEETF